MRQFPGYSFCSSSLLPPFPFFSLLELFELSSLESALFGILAGNWPIISVPAPLSPHIKHLHTCSPSSSPFLFYPDLPSFEQFFNNRPRSRSHHPWSHTSQPRFSRVLDLFFHAVSQQPLLTFYPSVAVLSF